MRISVIIPVLNEEKVLEEMLRDLTRQKPDEVIVVDGGSTDRTREIASCHARVISSSKGRACQMNEGARQASGDVFLFLHADTKLPENGLDLVREAIVRAKFRAGRFRMRFDSEDLWLKLYSSSTRFQFFSYGDQAFFATREIFEKLGGFSEHVPFEDIDFYRRLREMTAPVILKKPVTTSARRFLKVGKFRQKWINLALVTLYYLGVDLMPMKERVYQDVR